MELAYPASDYNDAGGIDMRSAGIIVIAFTGFVLAACASPGRPDDPAYAKQRARCNVNETFSCIERMGEPVRCFCADKDTLRELLYPTME